MYGLAFAIMVTLCLLLEPTGTQGCVKFKMASKNRGACEIDVKTSDESCADEMLLKTGKKCDLCKGNQSKYTCPKCMLRYCGVDCYKSEKHRKCSEDFYKDNVMRELKGMKPSDETKKQTMEILKRMMENEKNGSNDVWNDDESVENLANRLAGVDLDTASFDEMYSRLTEKEKKLFEGVVQSGEIEILDLCTPWWMHGSDGLVVVFICNVFCIYRYGIFQIISLFIISPFSVFSSISTHSFS